MFDTWGLMTAQQRQYWLTIYPIENFEMAYWGVRRQLVRSLSLNSYIKNATWATQRWGILMARKSINLLQNLDPRQMTVGSMKSQNVFILIPTISRMCNLIVIATFSGYILTDWYRPNVINPNVYTVWDINRTEPQHHALRWFEIIN